MGILQKGKHGALLAPELAAITAGAAALFAARGIARQGLPRVPQCLAATLEGSVIGVRLAILSGDAHAPLSIVVALLELDAGRPRDAVLALPLLQHVRWRAERGAPVDGG